MVILIAGETHTGKTLLAQKLLEAYRYPCLSLDHLKMGLIRSGQCALSPESDGAELTRYLWPIVREMIKTCIENRQNMIIEGCYIPFGWEDDFPDEYRKEIAYVCLVFSEGYIKERYADIARYESVIENRKEACPAPESLLEGNRRNLRQCILHSYEYILMVCPGYRNDTAAPAYGSAQGRCRCGIMKSFSRAPAPAGRAQRHPAIHCSLSSRRDHVR